MKPNRILPAATFLLLAAAANPANAAMDFVQGAVAFGTAILTIFGVMILAAGGYKAYEMMIDHRQIMPTILGTLFAVGLCFGGAWWLTTIGAGAGAPAIAL